jgi:hypothetical protein
MVFMSPLVLVQSWRIDTSGLTSKLLAGAPGFEPGKSVLETDGLTVEPTPLRTLVYFTTLLLHFLVTGVLPAGVTELLQLQPLGSGLPVLGRGVVAILALSAL